MFAHFDFASSGESTCHDRWRELYAAWLQYALLIFPDQHLARDQQIAFARRFGSVEFEMVAISNVKSDGTCVAKATTTT